jgi:type II secretory pathway pseudopilin PulG
MNTSSNRACALMGRRRKAGFSIIELLVAIIIIIILVAILLPLIHGRTAQARTARALSDLENMTEAEQRAAIDTGYYVRLFMLNDTLGGAVGFTRPPATNYTDGLGQYTSQPNFYVNTAGQLFLDPATNDLVAPGTGDALFLQINNLETSYDPTKIQWNGPYLNFTKDENLYLSVAGADGIPDDPWGNNYLLFTRNGMILEPDGVLVLSSEVSLTGGMTNGGSSDASVFDRPVILTMGPNGLPGDGSAGAQFGTGDDIFRAFGR